MIVHFDISRAHFMPEAEVEIPDEDPAKKPNLVGRLLRTWYGTQDASNLWQKHYINLIDKLDYRPSISNRAVFYSQSQDARMLVHGDDFVLLGDEDAADAMSILLKSKYEIKEVSRIGYGDQPHEAVILNQIIRYVPQGKDGLPCMELEADNRHVQLLIECLIGFGNSSAKPVETPRVKHSEDEVWKGYESRKLDRLEVTRYRSNTMRLSYLGQDRVDIQEATKVLVQKMSDPNEFDLSQLTRVARYLKRYPRAVLVYPQQQLPWKVDGWVDSDQAGDIITRKSTSGLCGMFGKHLIKSSSTVQDLIGLSSGEAEYYAAVKGGSFLLGFKSLLEDFGINTKLNLVVKTDSSAAKGMLSRRGLGKQRHISTRYLRIQERVARQDLTIQKVATKEQLADILTKPSSWKDIARVSYEVGLEYRVGSASKQKQLV